MSRPPDEIAELLEESAEDLYEAAPCGLLSTGPDGTIVKINQTLLEWLGYRRDEVLGRRTFAELLTAGGRIYYETHYSPLLRMQGAVREVAVDLIRRDGSRMPALVNSVARRSADDQVEIIRTTVFDATSRRGYERELLAAQRAAERSRSRLALLQQLVADLTVAPSIADLCRTLVDGVGATFGAAASLLWLRDDERGELVRADATTTGHPGLGRVALGAANPAAEVVRRNVVVVVPSVPAAQRPCPEVAGLMSETGAEALVFVPVTAGDTVIGVMGFAFTGAARLPADDQALLRTIGQQAGLALERAQLYDREHRNGLILQRGLLVGDPPDHPRVEIVTDYRPAYADLEVGGDWYDSFLQGPDRVALVVGDVVGRGIAAAATMGQLRSAVRALATVGLGPAALLERLDAFVERFGQGFMATLAYTELDLATGNLRYACAGHLPPLLIGSATSSRFLWDGRGAPLGAVVGIERVEAVARLVPGARLLLYTDGLVERRGRSLDSSMDRLGELGRRWHGRPLDALLSDLVGALAPQPHRDDICLLGAALVGDTR
jgi:PAS domain S-box-containing protein